MGKPTHAAGPKTYRFGVFEMDVSSWQFRKNGFEVHVQELPLRLLLVLLEHPGELVTREELRTRLWPTQTFVEFDDGLNTAVQKVRQALRDDARKPRFIETVPRQGYRFIAPVHVESEPADLPPLVEPAPDSQSAPEPDWRSILSAKRYWPWIILTAALAACAIVWSFFPNRTPGHGIPMRLSITPPPGVELRPGLAGGSAISPDGRTVVFVGRRDGKSMLWTRALDSSTARELSGTEDARLPFWSPDSQFIGFFAFGKLRRITVTGGPPQDLADVSRPTRGAWTADGFVLFSTGIPGPMYRVKVGEGVPVPATRSTTNGVLWPHFISGTDRFLFYDKLERRVHLGSLSNPNNSHPLFRADGNAIFSPPNNGDPGVLLWQEGTTLVGQVFDPKRDRLISSRIPVSDAIGFTEGWGLVDLSVSDNGILLAGAGTTTRRQLAWVRRDGSLIQTVTDPDWFKSVRLSADMLHAAVVRGIPGSLWIRNFSPDVMTRLTFEQESSGWPAWSPDGRQVAYSAERGGPLNVFRRSAGGATPEERLTTSPYEQYVYDWSPDGRFIVYCEVNPTTKLDLWILPVTGDRKPYPLLATPSNEDMPRFSPDGKWVAYVSDESGRNEVYVSGFPGAQGKWQISVSGGTAPRWNANGHELFYLAQDDHLMSVPLRIQGREFGWLTPRQLFATSIGSNFEVADGERFLVLQPVDNVKHNELTVLINWQDVFHR